MDHPASFWQAILEQPSDDAPRLRYADWLDDRCDPLGEFIRAQCRLARLPAKDSRTLELETRQRELLAEFEQGWVGAVGSLVNWWVFRRGFVEEIGLTATNFVKSGQRLFELAPIQEVHLYHVHTNLEPLISAPFLAKTEYLDLSSNPVRDQGAKLLACSAHLSRVRGLNLTSSGISDAGLEALARSPHLTGLRELYLCDNHISDAGVRVLTSSPLARRLTTLYLRFNSIGTDGANLLHDCFEQRVHL